MSDWPDRYRFAEVQVLMPTPEGILPFMTHFQLVQPNATDTVRIFLALGQGALPTAALTMPRLLPDGTMFALEKITIPGAPGSAPKIVTSAVLTRQIADRTLDVCCRLVPKGGGHIFVMLAGWGPSTERELRPWTDIGGLLEPFGLSVPADLGSLTLLGGAPPAQDDPMVFAVLRGTARDAIVVAGSLPA